jgi:protein-S-isoprenylcysteine O-methyltransferase Ste14
LFIGLLAVLAPFFTRLTLEVNMNDKIFRILAVIIFLTGVSTSIYFRSKAEREGGEKISLTDEGTFMLIALRLAGLTFWLSVFAYMLNPDWMTWSRISLPGWARWLGVGLGVLGDILAWWVFTNLGNNVTPTVVTRQNARLVTSGPYRWVRHPLYLMGLISYIGFALLAENWFIALFTFLAFALLAIRARKEEARLIEKFGDEYRSYMKITGRFFPRLTGLTSKYKPDSDLQ